jgi:hypothetical protein
MIFKYGKAMNRGMRFKFSVPVRILAFVALGLIAVFLFGLITMLLWNWLVPVLFNGPVVSFWQALGLLVLSKILFWGFGGKRHGHHGEHPAGHWKDKFSLKFSSMTPEERAAVKQKMKEKWCQWEESGSPKDSGVSND